ncbi:hypothetical protein H8356DRAFT_1656592 [Neocallimastix lanati (nom. inval.)]|nr:hypothetical protein H8356DRAFT_1656592 [Neocallimastix sp. JGI-2020a]
MSTGFQFKQEVCLNNILMAKKVSDYVDKDLITPLEIQVNAARLDVVNTCSNLSE